MTLVTGTVQDLGYDGMEGTLWARPARFRSDGSVVYAPERKPFTITGGVVSAELAPGPAVLELQVGSHARGTFEVVIPDTDITLADLLDTVFPWEPAQVSQFVAERELAVQAKTAAETAAGQASTAAGTATTAAQQTGQDRTAVAADKQVVVGHVQALAAPNDAAVLGLISEGATTQTKAALNATYGSEAWADPDSNIRQVADGVFARLDYLPNAYARVFTPEMHGAKGDGSTDDTAALAAAVNESRLGKATLLLGRNKTYVVSSTIFVPGARIDGNGSTIKVKSGTSQFTVFQSHQSFEIANLTFDLNKANTTIGNANTSGMAVYAHGASGWEGAVRLRDLRVINGHQAGIRVGGTVDGATPHLAPLGVAYIDNVVVENCRWGIVCGSLKGVVINSPTISGMSEDGIYDLCSHGTQVIGGNVTNCGGHGIVSQYSYGFGCVGAYVDGVGVSGITIGGGIPEFLPARNFVISGNHVRGASSNGISIDTTVSGFPGVPQLCHGSITGNVVAGNSIHGIYLHNADHVTVTGNVATENAHSGLGMDARNVAVAGNDFTGNRWGISFFGHSGNHGWHEVGNNILAGNSDAEFQSDPSGMNATSLSLQGVGAPMADAPVGSLYRRTDGGAGSSLYVREPDGWVPK